MRQARTALILPLLLCGCLAEAGQTPNPEAREAVGGKADGAGGSLQLNPEAGELVLYEVQVRSANACDPTLGAPWQRDECTRKVAPRIAYHAEGMRCDDIERLERIRLGTLDDMLEDTDDYRRGITLRYIDERVGANTVWLMPLFPNNDTWRIPDACDNLGSPYAVRDYLHARGTLARQCILDGRDEGSSEPCWGNGALEDLIEQAHSRGMRVLLDVAFNHFGHNYLMYDAADFDPVRERIARGDDLDDLWDFAATEDPALLRPEVLDSPEQLERLAASDARHRSTLGALTARCPDLAGQRLVRAYNTWRVALDWEREQFPCDGEYLEQTAPGFYLGADQQNPSRGVGDNLETDWRDVKFLFLHADNPLHEHELARQREYLFRVLNYWVSRGVDGFRLDHTADSRSGIGPAMWAYILGKVRWYAERRGQRPPVFLAEEFFEQMGMSQVVDIMTEGYVFDMNGRDGRTKDAAYVQGVLSNMSRFGGQSFVLTALETHDEHRLVDGTGFGVWTGAGFWGIGATTWSTPMLLMGQELGEPWGLAFRRSDMLRSRFEGSPNRDPDADRLLDYYRAMIGARLSDDSRALRSPWHAVLPARQGQGTDPRIFAQVKWAEDGNVVFTFFNLWEQHVTQSYYVPPDLAEAAWLRDDVRYRLTDVLTGRETVACRTGADLKWEIPVEMDTGTRMLWLRLERCD